MLSVLRSNQRQAQHELEMATDKAERDHRHQSYQRHLAQQNSLKKQLQSDLATTYERQKAGKANHEYNQAYLLDKKEFGMARDRLLKHGLVD